jgi:hypothetical protein
MSKDTVMTNTFLRSDSNTIQHTVTVHDPKIVHAGLHERPHLAPEAGDRRRDGVFLRGKQPGQHLSGAIKRWTPPEDEN